MTDVSHTPRPRIDERPGRHHPGLPVVLALLVVIAAAAGGIVLGASVDSVPVVAVSAALGALIGVTLLLGLTIVAPNRPLVLQFLGSSYSGTVHQEGLRWVNPLSTKRPISTRIRNIETSASKVNDADGNPIEISAIIVWQVADTARALFEVDDYEEFVEVQAEAAVRHIAGSFPYDSDERMSLRDNADEITTMLRDEVAERVESAGVHVVETRLNRLSYSPEIAQAMLRRQQAGAVIAARKQIVAGAVGMVEMALEKLETDGVVDLDEERRATMVSNLLVVLCGDRDTQPVLNTGSLYQ